MSTVPPRAEWPEPTEQTESRLAGIKQGSIPDTAIASLRRGLATNCTMCHAQ